MKQLISKILAWFGITWPKQKQSPTATIQGGGGPGEEAP